MSKVLAEQNLPERKRVDSALRGIRRDMRTIATYQLESSRAHRDLLQDLADKQGVRYKRPPELVEAEAAVRKLKNR